MKHWTRDKAKDGKEKKKTNTHDKNGDESLARPIWNVYKQQDECVCVGGGIEIWIWKWLSESGSESEHASESESTNTSYSEKASEWKRAIVVEWGWKSDLD